MVGGIAVRDDFQGISSVRYKHMGISFVVPVHVYVLLDQLFSERFDHD